MSLADQIYAKLKEKIFSGLIKPGDRLFEVEIARDFKASRTPVREAFRRLEQDFLVERTARGGVRLPKIDLESIEDLFSLRTVLESYAMELACERITTEQITLLRQIKAQALELLTLEDSTSEYVLRQFVELNSSFHDTIYKSTRSKFLERAVNNLREILQSMRAVSLQADNACDQAWQEHSLLIEYLSQGERQAAADLIKIHIKNAYRQLQAVYQKNTATGTDSNPAA